MSTRGIHAASAAILAAEAAFVLLLIPAMRAYPGGTSWDPASSGHDFWLNYLCDLTRSVALNGQPNPAGAALAQGAMGLLALGLLPFWWVLPQLFPSGARLGATAMGSPGTHVVARWRAHASLDSRDGRLRADPRPDVAARAHGRPRDRPMTIERQA